MVKRKWLAMVELEPSFMNNEDILSLSTNDQKNFCCQLIRMTKNFRIIELSVLLKVLKCIQIFCTRLFTLVKKFLLDINNINFF